jgi:alpha-tubulin suppressor-like RCC1 family protein
VSVDTVELRWRRAVDGGGTTLAPGRGACFLLPRTSPSQTTFSCETDFTEDHLGEQAFYAFANVRLFGVPLPVPIELAPNSRRSLLVSDERPPIDPSNAVAIGQFHGIAVRDDGTVWGWGRSTFNPGTYDPAPQRVPGIGDVVAVAIGGLWSLALRADGSVWQWDLSGVVPNGVACATCVPVPLSELDDVASIYGGHATAFAVTADGSLWGWGSNGTAELGIGGFGFEDFPYPVTGLPPVATVAPGYGHTVAIAANGGVWGWGDTRFAQTGQPPLDRDDENFRREIEYPEPAEVEGLARVAGGSEFSIAITTGGGLVSWGSRFNALGYVAGDESPFVFPPRTVPVAQPEDIAASVQNAYAVDADGVLWAWGANSLGALGSGTTEENRPSPGPVAGLPPMAAVWANHYTVAALGLDGSVWTWGQNDYGQAGSEPAGPCARPLNTTLPCQATPVEILSLDTGP